MKLSGCVALAVAGLAAGGTGGFLSAVLGSLLFCVAAIAAAYIHTDRRMRTYWRTVKGPSEIQRRRRSRPRPNDKATPYGDLVATQSP